MLLHKDDKARVTLRRGTCVLVPYSLYERPKTLAVARIEAILQVCSAAGPLICLHARVHAFIISQDIPLYGSASMSSQNSSGIHE